MEPAEYRRMYELENSFWFYVSLHSLVCETLKNKLSTPGVRILDAGCGTGRLLTLMARGTGPFGIDISKDAFKFAKKRGLDNLALASVCELPFKGNSFDVVTSMDVLYHKGIHNDRVALSEFHRILKSGGILVLSVAALEIMKGDHDEVVHTRKRYDLGELTSKLEKSGFQVVKGSYRLFFLSLPILLIRLWGKRDKGKRRPVSDLKPLPPSLNALLTWLQLFENRLLRFINFPFGSSLFFVVKKKV